MRRRLAVVVLASWVLASPAGCGLGRQPLPGDWQTGSDAGDESDPNTLDVSNTFDVEVAFTKLVDVLFVIDNSPTMGEEQLNVARNLGAMLDVLEADDVKANYRIAFTTTDSSNPWCPGTTPERGALVLSSCRSRLDEFVSGSGDDAIDLTAACLHGCPEAFTDIAIRPTTTLLDPTPKPRPWIQSDGCVSNLPEGMTTPQAMACFGPQGFGGCKFPQTLASMSRAIEAMHTQGNPADGFLRDQAELMIVIVTDGADCSYSRDGVDIFDPEGNRVFWSLPDEDAPTPAVCWNAGVRCTGGPGTYDDCNAEDFGVDGQPVSGKSAETQSVLHPVHRYVDLVRAIADHKQTVNPRSKVQVSLISGVPTIYPQGELTYQDAPGGTPGDPNFQTNFGIGPGCTSANGEAVPPVREREFAEALQQVDSSGNINNVFSICSDKFTVALQAVAEKIKDNTPPLPCAPICVADTDPSTPDVLDPACTMVREATYEDGSTREFPIPECTHEDLIPEGERECFIPIDVRHDQDWAPYDCVEDGANLAFRIVSDPDLECPRRGIAWVVRATCQPSTQPASDCPELP